MLSTIIVISSIILLSVSLLRFMARVRIDSPTQTPVAKEWFIEGACGVTEAQTGDAH